MPKTPSRRDFIESVALAGGLASADAGHAKAASRTRTGAIDTAYPRIYKGRQLAMLAFPLGGVGSGSISLGGRGQLRDWEVFNKPNKGSAPQYCFASVWAHVGNRKPVASIIEAALVPPYEGSSGLGTNNVPGLPRFKSASFTGEFPLARLDFADPAIPVQVSLDAFTPFIPHDADASGLPVAILRYRVHNPTRETANVSVAYSLDNPVGTTGRTTEYRKTDGVEGLFMRNPFLSADDPLAGSFALCAVGSQPGEVTYLRGWRGGTGWRVGPLLFWDDFTDDGMLGPEAAVRDSVGSLCIQKSIPAGAKADFTFLLSWNFPNRTPQRIGWDAPKDTEKTKIGNHYCTRFSDAWKSAEYAVRNLADLESRTRRFASAMRASTLPSAVKEAAMANLTTLVSPTSFRTADGVFHGWEGSNNQGGCCFGNCTHVWNYEAATAHVFPSLSRSLRENSFGFCTDSDGRQDFRQLLPADRQRWGKAAADGQMGQLMKLYFDWRLSGDTEWLRRLWPAAKRTLQFAWIEGGWDANRDGVMEGVQHNTYDVEFFGPNPLCGVWYLGALRASEEMARVVGDTEFAAACHTLFTQGSQWIDANLFNGEYYIQKIQGSPKDKIANGLLVGMGSANTEKPDFQLGDGCLIDQLVGQYMSDLAGLGNLLDPTNLRKTAASIYKYNYKRRMDRHESVQRVYALNDEAALVICDYGQGKRPEIPFPYFAEVMTGFEYAAAVLMIHRGMVNEGIECIENIRRRYDGERRNPWNEAECGHHYARAMASWAAIPALSGFAYDAAEKRVTAKPRLAAAVFQSFWSTGAAWGTFNQTSRDFALTVLEGTLPCAAIDLAWKSANNTEAAARGTPVPHTFASGSFQLTGLITLRAGDSLTLKAHA